LKNFEEDNFDGTEEKYEEKKYLERNRWIGRSHSTNYLFIYLLLEINFNQLFFYLSIYWK